jgi:hypothetical protein
MFVLGPGAPDRAAYESAARGKRILVVRLREDNAVASAGKHPAIFSLIGVIRALCRRHRVIGSRRSDDGVCAKVGSSDHRN